MLEGLILGTLLIIHAICYLIYICNRTGNWNRNILLYRYYILWQNYISNHYLLITQSKKIVNLDNFQLLYLQCKWLIIITVDKSKRTFFELYKIYMMKVCAGTSKTVVSEKDIKKLQNNIMVMVMQLMDFMPTRNESIEILEELMQILSNSEERFNTIDWIARLAS